MPKPTPLDIAAAIGVIVVALVNFLDPNILAGLPDEIYQAALAVLGYVLGLITRWPREGDES